VVGIDDFDDYYARAAKERNLAALQGNPHFAFVERDLAEAELSDLLDPGARIFHLAGQPGVRGSWGPQFTRYVRNNILATQRLLEISVRARPARFIYAGSSSVYGEQPPGPTSETALPSPLSPYGVTKLAAEHLCHLYRRAHGIPVVALRFFTVYGPRQRPDMAFHRFIEAMRANREITLFGDGSQTRDFTYVDDIVAALVAAGETNDAAGVYNLGGGTPASVRQVLAILEKLAGRPARLKIEKDPVGEPKATWADTSRARQGLGFRPGVSLEEGLRRQWEWQVTQPVAESPAAR
jgi:UDP-glucuronate 4-epimerase